MMTITQGRRRRNCFHLRMRARTGCSPTGNQHRFHPPAKPGLHLIEEFDLNVLAKYIDWTFFFFAWKLSGKYPAIFDDPIKGKKQKNCLTMLNMYLKEINDRKLLKPKVFSACIPAVSSGDDVKVSDRKATGMKQRRSSGS